MSNNTGGEGGAGGVEGGGGGAGSSQPSQPKQDWLLQKNPRPEGASSLAHQALHVVATRLVVGWPACRAVLTGRLEVSIGAPDAIAAMAITAKTPASTPSTFLGTDTGPSWGWLGVIRCCSMSMAHA